MTINPILTPPPTHLCKVSYDLNTNCQTLPQVKKHTRCRYDHQLAFKTFIIILWPRIASLSSWRQQYPASIRAYVSFVLGYSATASKRGGATAHTARDPRDYCAHAQEARCVEITGRYLCDMAPLPEATVLEHILSTHRESDSATCAPAGRVKPSSSDKNFVDDLHVDFLSKFRRMFFMCVCVCLFVVA